MVWALRLVAIAAIDGPVIAWLERYLGLVATTGAGRGIHLACVTISMSTAASSIGVSLSTARLLAGGAAVGAATGRISEPPAGIKLLLTNRKGKFLIAIAAMQGLIT